MDNLTEMQHRLVTSSSKIIISALPLTERIRLDGAWKKGMKLVGNEE